MIPWVLIIAGALCTVVGVLGLFMILVLPLKDRLETVFEKEKDVIQARLNTEIRKYVWQEKRHLTRDFIVCLVVGIMMFFAGLYLGYAAKGENFWLYRKLFPNTITVQVWDEINENGQFVAADGKAYSYYVLISERDISLSGEPCTDLEDLKTRLSGIRRENSVIIIDSFAVSSTYHAVENILNELGIEYEETR